MFFFLFTTAALISSSLAKVPVSANVTGFREVCNKTENFEIRNVCSGIPIESLKIFGENFGIKYLTGKVKSRVFVNSIIVKCKPGEYCVHLSEKEPSELEDRLLLSWSDPNIRRNLCGLRPCLSELPECGNPERDMILKAVSLMCDLTQPGAGTYCLEGGLDLLQYAFSDLHRSTNQTIEKVCDCSGNNTTCSNICREMIYKFNCFSSQCQPHEKTEVARFPAWNWFFKNQKTLMDNYNVSFCEKPIETDQNRRDNKGPVIYAIFPATHQNMLAIAITVILLSSILMVAITCLCWKRIFLPKYSRERVEYTEVKGT